MSWVRMDDGYPEHPKVDQVGPYAAWLNVCAWAYCARNLTDGFVPLERVSRLAAVPKPLQLAEKLVEARLWEKVDGGFMVHDYLTYNPSRERVTADRTRTAERVSRHRNASSNGVTPHASNGVTNGLVTLPPSPTPSPTHPVELEDSDESLAIRSLRSRQSATKRASPPGNPRVSAVIDAFRTATDQVPALTDRDRAAIKHSTAPPELIAEAFLAVRSGEWGDDFQRRRLSVFEACQWVPAFETWRSKKRAERDDFEMFDCDVCGSKNELRWRHRCEGRAMA